MNLSATVYKPNRQHNPPRYAWRKPASKHIRLSGTTGPNGSGPSANRFISKRARARSAGALPKPARPKTPSAKHYPNQPDPRRRRQKHRPNQPAPRRRLQNAAQTRKTAPRIRRPKHPRQKAPKIKMGSGPDPDPIGSFQSDAAQLRLSFTATSMFSWQRPLFAVDILDQP